MNVLPALQSPVAIFPLRCGISDSSEREEILGNCKGGPLPPKWLKAQNQSSHVPTTTHGREHVVAYCAYCALEFLR